MEQNRCNQSEHLFLNVDDRYYCEPPYQGQEWHGRYAPMPGQFACKSFEQKTLYRGSYLQDTR